MLEKLGEGGMASVWKARQVSLNRIVAIKILSDRAVRDATDVQMFQTEAQSAAKLKHPGIVQVYDANVENGVYYFVMEYVAGYTVGDWLKRKGVLSEKDALLVAECVADALDYAWERERIIHCDIKPDNIIIDSDGTVKVADLGLARTIRSMSAETVDDEVMGTPAYMSPEQAGGEANLDFRTDIYSLGAMLYHVLTGKHLFEGESDEEIMKMQLTGSVPDAIDVNPKASTRMSWVIEKMLAKNKDDRQKDWATVRADIARVKKGRLPFGQLPAEGASTIERSERRKKSKSKRSRRSGATSEPVAPVMRAVIAGVGGIIILAAILAIVKLSGRKEPPKRRLIRRQPVVTIPESKKNRDARTKLEAVRKWASENPGKYDEAIARFQEVLRATRGTKYAAKAETDIRKISAVREQEVAKVLAQLKERTRGLIDEEKFIPAAEIYERYKGPMAKETLSKRLALGRGLREHNDDVQAAQQQKKRSIEAEMEQALNDVVGDLVTGGLGPARKRVAKAIADRNLAGVRGRLKTIEKLLQAAINVDNRILESFAAQKGRQVTVQMRRTGKTKLLIIDVKDGEVRGKQKIGERMAPVTFSIDDLAPRERLLRMGSDDLAEVALVKGLMALNSKAYSHARKYFGKTHPVLADRLVAAVAGAEGKRAEMVAENALFRLMKAAGINVGSYDRKAWLRAIARKKLSASKAVKLREAVEGYIKRYGNTDFAKKAEPVINELLSVAIRAETANAEQPEPGKEKEVAEVAEVPERPPSVALPRDLAAIEGDGNAVVNLLLRRNSKLQARDIILHRDEDKVRGIQLRSGEAEDIGAVAALTDLTWFSYYPRSGEGRLKDISALRGLALDNVMVRNCRLKDISPLRQPSLRTLDLTGTNVRDLSHLKGSKIESLNLSRTKGFDYGPLAGLKLKYLNLNSTQVKNISFIKGMPLEHLEIADTKVYDFAILAGLKDLRYVNLNNTQIRDIGILKGKPLESLYLRSTRVSDIRPLKEMKLKRLDLGQTIVKDFSPLAGQPLTEFYVDGSRFNDIALINGMPLTRLNVSDTKVKELWPVRGMDLVHVRIAETRISDLSPLKGMKLIYLDCRKIKARDFGPIGGMPIETIWIDSPEGKSWLIRSLPKLRILNGVNLYSRSGDLYRQFRR